MCTVYCILTEGHNKYDQSFCKQCSGKTEFCMCDVLNPDGDIMNLSRVLTQICWEKHL